MSDGRIALRDLTDPRVDLQWFEAVAVTLGMAENWPDGAQQVPPFDAFTLSSDGAVRALPGMPFSATPARELGVALQALLVDRAAPQALREAADLAAQAVPGSPAAPHLRALTYFERPDRARLLLFLAQRAVPALPEADAEAELRKLAERARERALRERPPGALARLRSSLGGGWRRWRDVAAALIVVFAVTAAGWTTYRSPAARAAISEALARIETWLRPSPSSDSPAAESPAEDATRQTPAPRRTPAITADDTSQAPVTAERDATSPASAEPEGARASSVAVDSPAEEPLPPIRAFEMATPDAPSPAATDTAGGMLIDGVGRVFREGDVGVEPARIGRRYLPAESPQGVPDGRTGVFELVVDEKGRVERVQLLSADNRYQERMLVSAAKAWRFEPARKDGVPVKFLTQVKVTW